MRHSDGSEFFQIQHFAGFRYEYVYFRIGHQQNFEHVSFAEVTEGNGVVFGFVFINNANRNFFVLYSYFLFGEFEFKFLHNGGIVV